MRLIDADALEKEMCSGCEYNKSKYANCDDCAIANAPTIEPVKHGGVEEGKRNVNTKEEKK